MSVRGKAIVITLTEYVNFDRLDSRKIIFLLLIRLKFQKYELVIDAKSSAYIFLRQCRENHLQERQVWIEIKFHKFQKNHICLLVTNKQNK